MAWIQLHSGGRLDLLDPRAEDININDIAHALSLICRFNGHTRRFYSVAEHSVLVSRLVDRPEHRLRALLHDAAEAYLGDITRPLKQLLPDYRKAEARVWGVICERYHFGHDKEADAAIAEADQQALRMEAETMLSAWPQWAEELPVGYAAGGMAPRGLPPSVANQLFLATYADFGGKL